ncbi:MAG: GNAT family N-acetyltransferase [Actinomycetota bacterium]
MQTVLETSRLQLRRYTLEDLDDRVAMFADEETMRYNPRTKTRDETIEWIEWNLRSYAKEGFGLWVIELKPDGEFLGECGLVMQEVEGRREVELGYSVKRQFWRRGIAKEAAAAVRDYAFSQIGLDRLISIIHPANVASQRVAESIGMSLEKRVDQWGRPHLIYALEPH